ncbi:MAG: transcriptional repressor [Dethiobacter sp.]|nr:transcriptional repressor [Dethiobacter sp.]MBS3898351.1 transcriptional repressor [Dethiobacter sp.]MBS3983053.1 transcriptional repressor [Dethiobacter sp.]MCL4463666.1 transcriptional repressor [Bacillota bacterium]MCL5993787.1 transcriptional repressor [Bacillota bacterium]
MKLTFAELSTELVKKNLRPSHHRIKILEYLLDKQGHPSVDQIFNDLHKEIPTLSKSTVYNTLNLFITARLVRMLTIEDNETRYDLIVDKHGHFKCESCDTIYDFKINIDDFIADELSDFQINDQDVYFKGICPSCLSNKNTL